MQSGMSFFGGRKKFLTNEVIVAQRPLEFTLGNIQVLYKMYASSVQNKVAIAAACKLKYFYGSSEFPPSERYIAALLFN